MLKACLSFILLLLSDFLLAQTDTIYSNSSSRYARNIVALQDSTFLLQETEDGNFITCIFRKVDKNGNTIGTFSFGNHSSTQYLAYDVLPVSNDRLLITGDYQSPAIPLSMDSYVQLIDTAGNEIWKTDFGFNALAGGGKDKGEMLAKLDNRYVVAGRTQDYYTGGTNFISPSFWNSFLALFDTNGTLLRQESVGHIIDSGITYWSGFVYGMKTVANKVFLMHHITSSVPWKKVSNLVILDDSLQLLDTIPVSNEYYTNLFSLSGSELLLTSKDSLIKTDTNGNILWKKPFPVHSHIKSLQTTVNHHILLQCTKTYVSPFEPACFLYSHDTITLYLTDSDFTSFTPLKTYLDTITGTIHCTKGTMSADQGYAFAGDQDCNPWFVYLPYAAFTSTPEIMSGDKIQLYPNPVAGTIRLTTLPEDPVHISIYTAEGLLIRQHSPNELSSGIETGTLSPGYYLLRIQTRNGVFTTGFIKAGF